MLIVKKCTFFRNISKILLTNDLTEDVALEANNNGCQMIISYHPPIFAPLKSVVQRYIYKQFYLIITLFHGQ